MIKASIIIAAILTATAAHARQREFSIGLAEQQTKGLVAYYPMLVSGTTVTDRSGNGNDGTAHNSPTFSYANGYVGDGVGFVAASSQYIQTANSNPRGTAARSYSMWIRTTNTGNNNTLTSQGTDDYNGARTLLKLEGGNTLINRALNASATFTTSTIANGEWRHVVMTMPSGAQMSDIRMYLDGVELARTALTEETVNTAEGVGLIIGAHRTSGTGVYSLFFDGKIDEFRTHDYQLSLAEIKQRWRDDTTINRGR